MSTHISRAFLIEAPNRFRGHIDLRHYGPHVLAALEQTSERIAYQIVGLGLDNGSEIMG